MEFYPKVEIELKKDSCMFYESICTISMASILLEKNRKRSFCVKNMELVNNFEIAGWSYPSETNE